MSFPNTPRRHRPCADHDQPDERNGNKDFPAQAHNLVIAITRKVARAQIKMERSRKTLNASQKTPGINDRNANGASQPPRKSVAVSAEMTIILIYSARKNSANAIPE